MFDSLHGPSRWLASSAATPPCRQQSRRGCRRPRRNGADGFRFRSTHPTASRRNVEATWTRQSVALLHPGHRISGRGLLGLELDLVADLHLPEHRGILDAEGHGHADVHAEVLDRAVLEGDLAGGLVDLSDFALDSVALRGCGGQRQDRGEQRGRQSVNWFLHGCLLAVFTSPSLHFTWICPIMP